MRVWVWSVELGRAVLVLVVECLLELFVAEWWGQVVVLESAVEAATDLLDGQLWSVAGALVLADVAVEQEAQGGHENYVGWMPSGF